MPECCGTSSNDNRGNGAMKIVHAQTVLLLVAKHPCTIFEHHILGAAKVAV